MRKLILVLVATLISGSTFGCAIPTATVTVTPTCPPSLPPTEVPMFTATPMPGKVFKYPLSDQDGTKSNPISLGSVFLHDAYAITVVSSGRVGVTWMVDMFELQGLILKTYDFQIFNSGRYYHYYNISVTHNSAGITEILLFFSPEDVGPGSFLVWEGQYYFLLE